ncbi:MAG: NAD(P) transhydrogenase subunit alpha [Coriobacteriia bacterium]|nr:NAD(P) transhydrogenase subunit alpha [Coriobacteriia bacterium]
MIIGIPKEILEREHRVAALPDEVAAYVNMGFTVLVETGAGLGSLSDDDSYRAAGATVVPSAAEVFSSADVILKVKQPHFNHDLGAHEADMIREGATLITFLHPAAPANLDIVRKLRDRNITSLTMDGIPRTSRAQSMDALSSMSTVTGYKSVIMATAALPRFVPMIGTAIGATKPAEFLMIGTGVVGLQAIATAKRLGGVVKAVDIRAAAREEAASLGAKVVGFEAPEELALGEGGYAGALPTEWIEREREALAPLVAAADVVILSALVPSEVAPVLITPEMVASMRPGSVIVDVSVDQGGNCALTVPAEETVVDGVTIMGYINIPGSVPVHASWLYSKNMLAFVRNMFKDGADAPADWDDEIVRHTLVTRNGEILHVGALHSMGGTA